MLPQYSIGVYDREKGTTRTIASRYGSAFTPVLSKDGKWLVYGTRFEDKTGLVKRNLITGEETWLAYPVQRDVKNWHLNHVAVLLGFYQKNMFFKNMQRV